MSDRSLRLQRNYTAMILSFTGTSSRHTIGGRIGWKKRSRTACVVAGVSLLRLLQTYESRAKRKTFANCGSSTGKPKPRKRPPRCCSNSFHHDWLEPFPDRLSWCEDRLCRFTFEPLEDIRLGGYQPLLRRVSVTSPNGASLSLTNGVPPLVARLCLGLG